MYSELETTFWYIVSAYGRTKGSWHSIFVSAYGETKGSWYSIFVSAYGKAKGSRYFNQMLILNTHY